MNAQAANAQANQGAANGDAAQFQSMVDQFQQALGDSGNSNNFSDQAKNIIGAADGNNDQAVTGQELADRFGVSENLANDFVSRFDQAGSGEGLDQQELSAALEAVSKGQAGKASGAGESGGGQAAGNNHSGCGKAADNDQAGKANAAGNDQAGNANAVNNDADASAVGDRAKLFQAMREILDTNGDGQISDEEIQAFEAKHGNGDGNLTTEELKSGLQAEGGNGAEFSDNLLDQVASEIDTDNTGSVNAQQLTDFLNQDVKQTDQAELDA